MAPRKHSVAIDGPMVRRIRTRLDISQATLADRAYITRQYLVAIEKDASDPRARTFVSRLVLEALAGALGIEPEVLVAAEDAEPAPAVRVGA